MNKSPTMIYFDMLGDIQQELWPAKHYEGGDGGGFCTWYSNYDKCEGVVCQLFGTYESGNQDQLSTVQILIDMQSSYAVDLIWQAGRNSVVLTSEVPAWARGKIASAESHEGQEAMKEHRQRW